MIITVSHIKHGTRVIQKLKEAFPDAIEVNCALVSPEELDNIDRDATVIFTEYDRAPYYVVKILQTLHL